MEHEQVLKDVSAIMDNVRSLYLQVEGIQHNVIIKQKGFSHERHMMRLMNQIFDTVEQVLPGTSITVGERPTKGKCNLDNKFRMEYDGRYINLDINHINGSRNVLIKDIMNDNLVSATPELIIAHFLVSSKPIVQ